MSKAKSYGVIYARYSPGPNQTDQSIEGQVRDCEEYAKKYNIQIIDVYADRHLSGTESEHRLEFQRMLHDAEKKHFSTVIVWKIDRFGRNREEIAMNKVHLKKYGVTVAYAKEHIPDGPEGIILESMLEGMAEYYSAELAQKIRRGQRESVLKGRILTRKPLYGYKKNERLEYILDEAAAPVVRSIFEMYAEGAQLKEICDTLNEKAIRNANGNPFRYTMLHNMLRNRQYIGEYRFGDNVNLNAIPPIISMELWDKCQERINSSVSMRPITAATSKADETFHLTGKITCSICGYHYQGESGTSKTGTRHYYYKCHGKKQKKSNCTSRNFVKDQLEDFILLNTFSDVLTDKMIANIADRVIEYQDSSPSSFAIKSLERQLKECNKKIDNIMKAIEAGIFTPTTRDRLAELESEKEAVTLSLTQEKNKSITFTREHVIFWLELFRDGDIDSKDFKDLFFNMFINSVAIYEDRLVIAYNVVKKEVTLSFEQLDESVRLHVTSVE